MGGLLRPSRQRWARLVVVEWEEVVTFGMF